jgi:HSP20 family molecular chaperone IbpA
MTRKTDRPRGAAALGLIEERLNDLFGTLRDALENREGATYERSERFGDERGLSGVSSVRVRVGGLGDTSDPSPRSERPRQKPARATGAAPETARCEVHRDGDDVVVTMELPGATQGVETTLDQGTLNIWVDGALSAAPSLPEGRWRVVATSARNGILSVTLTGDAE